MNRDYSARMTPSFAEGVLLALNSIPDAALAVEGPACVRTKMERICRNHDLHSTLYCAAGRHRMATTDRGPARVLGSLDTIKEIARNMLTELQPAVLFLLPYAAQQAMGMDLDAVARELAEPGDARILPLHSDALEGDWLDGWAEVFSALARGITAPAKKAPDSVSVAGLLHTRNEGDDIANAAEVCRLLEGLGLDVVSVWSAGEPFERLAQLGGSSFVISLPHAAPFGALLAERCGAQLVEAPLPVGLTATADFIRAVGAATDRAAKADHLVATETAKCTLLLNNVVSLLADEISVAVLADQVLAPALHQALGEIGVDVPLTGVLGARELPRAVTALSGRVVQDPSFRGWERVLAEAVDGGVQLVLGSGLAEVAAHKAGAQLIELGFPCHKTHFLTPTPYLGFQGLLKLVERIINAYCAGEAGRRLDEAARGRSME